MEEVKRKRGRPKKIKLPEEIKEIIQEATKKPSPKEEIKIEEPKKVKKSSSKWDVPKDTPITYFDSTLSYELTGYKPITKTKSLDFNPKWFTEVRDTYNRTGHYTEFREGSKAYADFWDREYLRCRDGMTVNDYTITGDHYYFLNYYQLMNLSNVQKAGTSRLYTFPDFYVAQYQWFHYLELCKRLLKNACLMKARGIGQRKADIKFRKIGED